MAVPAIRAGIDLAQSTGAQGFGGWQAGMCEALVNVFIAALTAQVRIPYAAYNNRCCLGGFIFLTPAANTIGNEGNHVFSAVAAMVRLLFSFQKASAATLSEIQAAGALLADGWWGCMQTICHSHLKHWFRNV